MNPKQLAGHGAMKFISDGMVVGLGTGSTADFFLIALGEAIRAGRLNGIRGIPTSKQSERRAQELEIPLVGFADGAHPDVTIDGADEIGPNLTLIKGLGGALLREKVVAQNSGQLVIIADAGKEVTAMGTKSPLPVEVTVFGHEIQPDYFRALGCEPVLRKRPDGGVYVTDNGNYIYDCKFKSINDPAALEGTLKKRAGIVETGLFIGIAKMALIADDNGVRERRA